MKNLTSEQVEIIKDQIEESVSYGSMYPNVARTLVEILEEAINYTHSCTELQAIEELKDFAYNNCQLHNTDQLEEIIERL